MAHEKITGSVWGGTGWYLVELGQYNSVLLWSACIYIEKAEIWSGDTNPLQTHSQTTEYSATKLL